MYEQTEFYINGITAIKLISLAELSIEAYKAEIPRYEKRLIELREEKKIVHPAWKLFGFVIRKERYTYRHESCFDEYIIITNYQRRIAFCKNFIEQMSRAKPTELVSVPQRTWKAITFHLQSENFRDIIRESDYR